MQPLALVEPFPASCLSTSSPPPNSAELVDGDGILQWALHEFPLDIDDFINDGPVTCSNLEEQLPGPAMPNCNMCADDFSHDHQLRRDRNALSVATDETNMDCSLDALENWLDATNLLNMESSAMLEELLQQRSEPSLACDSIISPACDSGMISLLSIADSNTVFIESSPVHPNTHQYDSLPVDYMSNHVTDHLGIADHATNSTCVSYSPSDADDDVPRMFSGSADDSSGDMAAFFAAMESSQLFLVPPLPNLEATTLHAQLNLAAKSSPPLHKKFKADHRMNETRAIKNSGDCEANERVSFLVESCTPAIDDGYKWCKYGQKNIKDLLHPRCYFRCAQQNCPVKKQTESSSIQAGYVLITYFGKHNH